MSLLFYDQVTTSTIKLIISTLTANPGGLNELELLREVHDNHGIDVQESLQDLRFTSLKEFVQISTVEDFNNKSVNFMGNKSVNLTNMIEIREIDLESRRMYPVGKTFYKLKNPKHWKSAFHKTKLASEGGIARTVAFEKEWNYERKYDDIVTFNRFHYEEKCHEIVNDVSLQANFDTSAPRCDFVPFKLRMNVRQLLLNERIVRQLQGWGKKLNTEKEGQNFEMKLSTNFETFLLIFFFYLRFRHF